MIKIKHWIQSFIVVSFDNTEGQIIDLVYPPEKEYTKRCLKNISFYSLPDTGSTTVQSPTVSHNFTFLLQSKTKSLNGVVHFVKLKSKTAKRGYVQRSLVLISEHNFHQLFLKVVSLIGQVSLIEEDPTPMLKRAFEEIEKNWPKEINPQEVVGLKIFGRTLNSYFPSKLKLSIAKPLPPRDVVTNLYSNSNYICCDGFYGVDINLYSFFRNRIKELPLLWQLMIGQENLLITSDQASLSSTMVLLLPSLIYPLIFKGTLYPYFTVQNSGLSKLAKKTFSKPKQDPNIKGNNNNKKKKKKNKKSNNLQDFRNDGIILGNSDPIFAQKILCHWENKWFLKSPSSKKKNKKSQFVNEGYFSKTKPLTKFGSLILKRLSKINKSKVEQEEKNIKCNLLLRKYFFVLTRKFLLPLEEYFLFLIEKLNPILPFYSDPIFKGFDENEFLQKFKDGQLSCDFNNPGQWAPLYNKFIHTDTFMVWYETNKQRVIQQYSQLYVNKILNFDIQSHISNMNDTDKVDLFYRITEKSQTIPISTNIDLKNKIFQMLKIILSTLPNQYQQNLSEKLKQLEEAINDESSSTGGDSETESETSEEN
ncbi:hypothetical protein M0813_01707 [Anaeramoeba flamelloides]|uniref:UDENN domain-containing protein n=1 Tax=Anaeramoeba flamelloides TaxID=1746091 RepID=A0ABQ8YWR6_9EUKA|nr:hypothetical protein M0813_01707 [Anaeramoeba flamelloides]